MVIVPVLSIAIFSIFPASSSTSAVLNKIPFFAPLPFPTIIATGVARPSAHGQLMTRTVIPLASEYDRFSPAKSQIIVTIIEISMTAGTNIPETLSAIFPALVLLEDASLTSWII